MKDNKTIIKNKGILDVVKYRWLCILISAILLIPGIIAMGVSIQKYHAPLLMGIDFTGGTMLQYGFKKEVTKADEAKIREVLAKLDIENPIIQTAAPIKMSAKAEEKNDANAQSADTKASSQDKVKDENKDTEKTEATADTAEAKDAAAAQDTYVVSIKTRYLETTSEDSEKAKVDKALKEEFGDIELLQTNAIGPTLGNELFKNSMITLLLAFVGIIVYLTFRFQFDYALFAFLALVHDAIFVIGTFSIFGLVYNTHIDGLFITAVLTVIGFSVHDTIVIYDRIRENCRFMAKKMSFGDITNYSVNQTLMRSIATSVTTLLTLLALYFLGGETTKDFVLAMILGIAIGTYSSIFFASALLVMYREHKEKQKAIARRSI